MDPDGALDASDRGRILIGACADAVAEILRYGDGDRYALHAWCVMPNHVHVLVQKHQQATLRGIVQVWKSLSARAINRAQGGVGRVWQPNYFDRYIRDDPHYAVTIAYIENNPVAAGLVADAGDWRWSSAWRQL